MKNILTILIIIFCFDAGATNYFVKNTGNNANTGLSDAQAWQTIAKVNGTSFSPGDTIFFNKGDTWRETLTTPSSGNSGAYIVFTSYGTGLAPKIFGSTALTAWTNDAGNVWFSNNTVSDPYALSPDGNIYFKETDGDISWGRVKKATQGELAVEYDWIWISNKIYIYSPTNPNTRYSGVEVTQRLQCVNLNNKNYVSFIGLELAYSGDHGIGEEYPPAVHTGLIVKSCHIHHVGIKQSTGGYGIYTQHSNTLIQNNEIHDCGRRGVSIYADSGPYTVSDIIIDGNTFYHGFHTTGIDVIIAGSVTLNNITVRNNLVYDDLSETLDGIESYQANGMFFSLQGGASINNLLIHNNAILNTTNTALKIDDVASSFVYNNTIYGVNPNFTEQFTSMVKIEDATTCTMKNNIVFNNMSIATNANYWSIITDPESVLVSDYNLFWRSDATARLIAYNDLDYTRAQWADYKSVSGQDANSPNPDDPLFISTSDFRLQAGSPAINAGVYVGFSFSGSAPDIGAFEFNPPTNFLIHNKRIVFQ